LADLKECVDTVITIPNERLLATLERGTSLFDAFRIADDILRQAVQGISDLITVPGLINLDFADVKTVMAGMGMALMGTGGATRAGAAPSVASVPAELGALTVAVVTKPFAFEGKKRQQQADRGLTDLKECVDTVITIPNERLLATLERGTSLFDAFRVADDILRQAVQGISDLIIVPGLINLDFADVKTVMSGMGMALMGTGAAKGENRAVEAAKKAISSRLLEESSIQGARGVLINITGGQDLLLHEVSEASNIIHDAADGEANIIFGAVLDESMKGEVKITVIATGFDRRAEAVGVAAAAAAGSAAKVAVPDPDLEIPAFLRRAQK